MPRQEQMPEWVQQGKLRVTRLDGGPLEVLKTRRSWWGRQFTAAQQEVLANLYTKYSDRMLDLLEQAHINQVWLTWSVGYSWEDEAEQRDQCKRFVARLHERGIKAAAYTCAVSMFWESMFRDEPRSVRWISFDPAGVPFRYGGHDPLRFIADISNPEHVELVKRRVGAAIDAGFDSLFFDNTTGARNWNEPEAVDAFMGEIRRYIHDEKHSNLLLFTNYGLGSDRVQLNRNQDFVFAEGWREPGVWGTEWSVGNIRRTKYVRGVIPEWKSLTAEYSDFHSGNMLTTFLAPRSQKRATAEAAAFQADHCWDMEGPFDGALLTNDPAALASWKAIGDYRLFLKQHEDLYWKARSVSPIAVLAPEKVTSFAWDREDTGLLDALSRHSVLYDIRPPFALDSEQLKSYQAVVVPTGVPVPAALAEYKNRGGKVYTAASADDRTIAEISALTPRAPSLSIEGAPYVLGNVTRPGSGKRLAVHLLNYAPEAVSKVQVRVNLGAGFGGLTSSPVVFTPDGSGTVSNVKRTGSVVEFTLDRLDIYTVVVFGS
jgi:hypothetical protein